MAEGKAVITAVARTPFGRFNGALRGLSTARLGAMAMDEALRRANLDASAVDAAYMGCGMIGAATLTPARQAVLLSELPETTPSFAVDRACCSGMTAIGSGWKDIRLGEAKAVLCGGSDNLSATPMTLPRSRERMIGKFEVGDPLLLRGEVVDKAIACYTAEEALRHGVDRSQQDDWAASSHERYFEADEQGYFDFERFPVEVKGTKGASLTVTVDESPRTDTTREKLASLRTVYDSETITAGNAPGLNDGAAFLVLAEEAWARAHGLPVLAQVLDYVQVADGATSGSYTPAIGIARLLGRNNLQVDRVDALEINEAFAATPLVSTLRLAENDPGRTEALRGKTNHRGGAVAIGHPLGASGTRLAMTLVNGLRRRGGGLGAAAICGGFGQGDALLLKVDG